MLAMSWVMFRLVVIHQKTFWVDGCEFYEFPFTFHSDGGTLIYFKCRCEDVRCRISWRTVCLLFSFLKYSVEESIRWGDWSPHPATWSREQIFKSQDAVSSSHNLIVTFWRNLCGWMNRNCDFHFQYSINVRVLFALWASCPMCWLKEQINVKKEGRISYF